MIAGIVTMVRIGGTWLGQHWLEETSGWLQVPGYFLVLWSFPEAWLHALRLVSPCPRRREQLVGVPDGVHREDQEVRGPRGTGCAALPASGPDVLNRSCGGPVSPGQFRRIIRSAGEGGGG